MTEARRAELAKIKAAHAQVNNACSSCGERGTCLVARLVEVTEESLDGSDVVRQGVQQERPDWGLVRQGVSVVCAAVQKLR